MKNKRLFWITSLALYLLHEKALLILSFLGIIFIPILFFFISHSPPKDIKNHIKSTTIAKIIDLSPVHTFKDALGTKSKIKGYKIKVNYINNGVKIKSSKIISNTLYETIQSADSINIQYLSESPKVFFIMPEPKNIEE